MSPLDSTGQKVSLWPRGLDNMVDRCSGFGINARFNFTSKNRHRERESHSFWSISWRCSQPSKGR